MSRLPFHAVVSRRYWISEGINCVRFLLKFANWKIGPLSHLNGFHVFPCDNIRETFTVMHYQVIEHKRAISFAFLVCIILYIDGKQFSCGVFTFDQYNFIRKTYPLNSPYHYIQWTTSSVSNQKGEHISIWRCYFSFVPFCHLLIYWPAISVPGAIQQLFYQT